MRSGSDHARFRLLLRGRLVVWVAIDEGDDVPHHGNDFGGDGQDETAQHQRGDESVSRTGTVTEVAQAGMRVNEATPWQLRYRYVDHRGHEHRGVSGDLSAPDAGQWQPGSAGAVRYDRERPGRSVWLGDHPSR